MKYCNSLEALEFSSVKSHTYHFILSACVKVDYVYGTLLFSEIFIIVLLIVSLFFIFLLVYIN
jgi:hypothetical protein